MQVGRVESAGKIAEYDHGKFKALALVYAHDAHNVVSFGKDGGGSEITLLGAEFFDEAQEPGQALPGEAVKLSSAVVQMDEVPVSLAGLRQAAQFSWEKTAHLTMQAYEQALEEFRSSRMRR